MRKGILPKRTEEIKYKKKFEEAEDHKDEYHADRNAENNLGAERGQKLLEELSK